MARPAPPTYSELSTSTDPLEELEENVVDEELQPREGEEPLERRADGSLTSFGARKLRIESSRKHRERKADAERNATSAHLTFRQRLGVALSKLTQDELDVAVKKLAHDGLAGDTKAIHALARLADQSFGRSGTEAVVDDRDVDELEWQEMTPAQRAAYRVALMAEATREAEQVVAAGVDTDPRQGSED